MEKYIIVVPGYPSETNTYKNAFVHTRVKNYVKMGLNLEIFSVNIKLFATRQNKWEYVYDGIAIEQGSIKDLICKLKSCNFDKILIHYGIKKIISSIVKAVPTVPLIIWFHGVDIISWHRRLYNLRASNIIKFTGYAMLNTVQRLYLKKFLHENEPFVHCVFVSNWLKNVAELDIHSAGRIKNYSIIPNVIDEKVFLYHPKKEQERLKILSIRSYESKNYANDLTVKTIQALAVKPFFNDMQFTICGEGRLWNSITKKLKKYPNVSLIRKYFNHNEIVQLHRQHGIILMPSRQDTHGVSTCEGMSSGLVAISSNNSAIPEYIPKDCGYLADDYQGLVNAIEDMYYNPEKFLEYSKKSSDYILSKCASYIVIKNEISLIKS